MSDEEERSYVKPTTIVHYGSLEESERARLNNEEPKESSDAFEFDPNELASKGVTFDSPDKKPESKNIQTSNGISINKTVR